MKHLSVALIASAALFSANATAQVVFDPNIGTGIGAGDDSVTPGNALGFNFTMPDGSVVTAIDIDSNGLIYSGGSGAASDFTESAGDLVGSSAKICCFWDDLNPSDGLSDDVYFNAYNNGTQNVAVITWNQCVEWGQTTPFTAQLILKDDNSFSMYWDAATPATDCIVGMSPGGGVVDPGESPDDWRCSAVVLSTPANDPTLYTQYAGGEFDLQDFGIDVFADGLGGWVVTTNATGACASATVTGVGCGGFEAGAEATDYTPDGSGGYVATPSAEVYDANLGSSLGIAADDANGTAALGFNFTMPGGAVVTQLTVDANGRVHDSTDASDFSPTVGELHSNPGATICPAWGDFNVTDPDTLGDIMFNTNGTDFATITWDRIAQFAGDHALTMQLQLFGDAHPSRPGSWTVVYEDMGDLDVATGFGTAPAWIVGCSAGNGAVDPGESNLDPASLPALSTGPELYEFFDSAIADMWDLTGNNVGALDLTFQTNPVLGSSFDTTLDSIPASAVGASMMIGFSNLNLDISLVFPDVLCFLYSSNDVPAQPMVFNPGDPTATYSLPISVSATAGLPLVLQAAIINFGANSLNVETSNAVEGVVGS